MNRVEAWPDPSSPERNCRNCGAPPRPFSRACVYCGTTSACRPADWPPVFAVYGAEKGEAVELLRALGNSTYVVVPDHVKVEMIRGAIVEDNRRLVQMIKGVS